MNCREHCRKFRTKHCFHPGMQQCAGFEEKEKPMENKVIFESEEEAIRFYFDTVQYPLSEEDKNRIRKMNLIRKSPVEEAEEYEKHIAEIMDKGMSASIKDLEWSIRIMRELKAENEKPKK